LICLHLFRPGNSYRWHSCACARSPAGYHIERGRRHRLRYCEPQQRRGDRQPDCFSQRAKRDGRSWRTAREPAAKPDRLSDPWTNGEVKNAQRRRQAVGASNPPSSAARSAEAGQRRRVNRRRRPPNWGGCARPAAICCWTTGRDSSPQNFWLPTLAGSNPSPGEPKTMGEWRGNRGVKRVVFFGVIPGTPKKWPRYGGEWTHRYRESCIRFWKYGKWKLH